MSEPRSAETVRIESIWTVHQPPTRFAADVRCPGLFTESQAYDLADAGNGHTRVQIESRIRYTSWFIRLLEPMVTPVSTRKLEQDLMTVKQLVEKSTAR